MIGTMKWDDVSCCETHPSRECKLCKNIKGNVRNYYSQVQSNDTIYEWWDSLQSSYY